jgi:hypothetical protein
MSAHQQAVAHGLIQTGPHPMQSSLYPRRRFARLAGGGILFLLLWWGGVVAGFAQIRLDVTMGYEGITKEGTWFPVTCEAINSGPNFIGFIELSPGPGGRGQTQRVPIELPTGTRKRVFIPAFATTRYPVNWMVRLVDDRGRVREEVMARSQLQVGWETKLVGALPRTAAGMIALRPIKRNQPDLQPASARLQRDLLPDNPLLLEGLEAIYLNSEAAVNLRAGQAGALQAWLHAGGHLIVAIEEVSDIAAAPWLRDLLPVTPREVVTLAQAGALVDWVQHGATSAPAFRGHPGPYGEITPDPIFAGAELRVVAGRVRDGQALVSVGATPLLVTANRGLGRLTVLLFSPEREPFKSWKELPTFWTRLVEVPASLYTSTDYHPGHGMALDSLFGAMIDSRQVHKLPVGWLLALLVVYLLVIGPLDRLWLKKINRPMLTWITFPGYVIFFSGLIYFIGYKLRAGDSEYNELHVVNVVAAGEQVQWRGRTYASIYSPVNARYPLHSELKFATLRGEHFAARSGDAFDKGELLHTGDNFQADAFVPVWTSQLYLSDWWQAGSNPLLANIQPAPDGWRLEVQNLSGTAISAVWLAIDDQIFTVGDLAPGQRKTVPLDRNVGQDRQAFIATRMNAYENAARERQHAFGRRGGGRIDDLPVASVIASFLDEKKRTSPGQSLIPAPGFGVSDSLARGGAILFAWAPDAAPVPGLNQFKTKRTARNTLWRLPLVVSPESL